MSKVLVKQGVFSKIYIELNQDLMNHLAQIPKQDNPLANVEKKLVKALEQFEKDYTKAVRLTNEQT